MNSKDINIRTLNVRTEPNIEPEKFHKLGDYKYVYNKRYKRHFLSYKILILNIKML